MAWAVFWLLLLSLPLFIASPLWPLDLLDNLRVNHEWLQPALFSVLRVRFGAAGLALWCVLFVACIWLALRTKSLPLALALTTLCAPYLWSWDFVLLLPLMLERRGKLMAMEWLVILVCVPASLGANPGDDGLWWIPVIVIGAIIPLTKYRYVLQ